MEDEIRRLAAEVADGLERRELAGRTVTVKVRYDDFTTVTRSHTLLAPTADGPTIERCALDLLTRTEAGERPVRLLGVTVSNLVAGGGWQLPLFEEG
jgi:DNA polymerase-4